MNKKYPFDFNYGITDIGSSSTDKNATHGNRVKCNILLSYESNMI